MPVDLLPLTSEHLEQVDEPDEPVVAPLCEQKLVRWGRTELLSVEDPVVVRLQTEKENLVGGRKHERGLPADQRRARVLPKRPRIEPVQTWPVDRLPMQQHGDLHFELDGKGALRTAPAPGCLHRTDLAPPITHSTQHPRGGLDLIFRHQEDEVDERAKR